MWPSGHLLWTMRFRVVQAERLVCQKEAVIHAFHWGEVRCVCGECCNRFVVVGPDRGEHTGAGEVPSDVFLDAEAMYNVGVWVGYIEGGSWRPRKEAQ